MKIVIVALSVCALLVGTQMPAFSEPKVEPRDGANVLLQEEKHIPAYNNRRRSTAEKAPKVEPIKLNAWGAVPCATLPNGRMRCFGQGLIPPPKTPANVTPGEILTAVKTIGLPSLKINIQPGEETLVNLDTIFFARPQPFQRSVTLLGYEIDLVADPVGYTWQHGDGTSHTTSKPGGAYPSKDVTYRYQQSADNLHPSVDVTYAVRYRVDGGGWQNLGQTLRATGPAGDLDVREATPVLAHY